MKIYNKKISNKSLPFIIAEIGINHNGNINNAFKLIDYAAAAKCDAVKFQTINVNKLLSVKRSTNMYMNVNKFENKFKLKLPSIKNEIINEAKKYL